MANFGRFYDNKIQRMSDSHGIVAKKFTVDVDDEMAGWVFQRVVDGKEKSRSALIRNALKLYRIHSKGLESEK